MGRPDFRNLAATAGIVKIGAPRCWLTFWFADFTGVLLIGYTVRRPGELFAKKPLAGEAGYKAAGESDGCVVCGFMSQTPSLALLEHLCWQKAVACNEKCQSAWVVH